MAEQGADPRARVAVVDDDDETRMALRIALEVGQYQVETFSSPIEAMAWLDEHECDCIVSDVMMPGMDGEAFLAELKRRNSQTPIIIISGHGDVAMAVRCLKAGAYDFVEKPLDQDVLTASVRRAVEKNALAKETAALKRRLRDVDSDRLGRFGMVGRSRVMEDLYEQVEVLARSNAPVLVYGETGAGKELVARAIHDQSRRSEGPFVPVNAGALPETMLESELFGHVRGAFTSAESDRDGKLVTASGGTLLLDEVESLSLSAQIKLLRVLEDGLVQPLGTDDFRAVDVRLITTTKLDLRDLVKTGRMREDFFHRVVVLSTRVPPLRERPEDIPLLVSYFARQASNRNEIPLPRLPEDALMEMARYNWPGNVRELKHAVERMVVTAEDGVAGPLELNASEPPRRMLSLPSSRGRLRDALERVERSMIENALRETQGEVLSAARYLGISRRGLYERLDRYGLKRGDFRPEA
ncbi:MAG TPA: sigma-54 dependent transcriptional regulator [Candidatus Brocadiia bacterium]|nr:sigma-54 dependent transcriptional regulator [Candidatus Brocadiia bacterium]